MIKTNLVSLYKYVRTFFKWLFLAGTIGAICGVIGAIFHLCIDYATEIREQNTWILYLLPLGGIFIVFLYKIMKMEKNGGTNNVINSVKDKERIPWKLAPLIFISTVLTHFFGGSSGREGAALQLGGSIGEQTARLFRQDKMNRNIVIMCGMSAVFSALFGMPVTATVFSMEVISVGVMHYASFLPCIISSLISYYVASLFGIKPVNFTVLNIPDVDILVLLKICALAALCAGVSILFCLVMKNTSRMAKKILKNGYIRVVLGSLIIISLTVLVGNYDYNGAGMDIVAKAIEGKANWYDFILKIIFTAITLGVGFKGGEIVPTFFVGATFGCVFGQYLGVDAGFAAALGLIAVFCGVVNCPLASIMMAIELFGGEGIFYYALVVGVSYVLSGYYGLYSSQNILYSKLRTEYIDKMVK